MQQADTTIDPLEYTNLAWKHSNTSGKKFLRGANLEDIFQSAMVGICEAAKVYDCSKDTKFEVFAFWYIQRAINKNFYKAAFVNKKCVLVPICDEALYNDLPDIAEINYEDCGNLAFKEDKEGNLFIQEFMEGLPLTGVELQYFKDIVLHGERDASTRYREATGFTIQRAMQVKNKVKKVAANHFEECL